MAKKEGFFGKIGRFYNRHMIISHLILIILTGIALVMGLMLFIDAWTNHGAVTTVPEVSGMRYTEAKKAFEQAGLEIEIKDSVFNRDLKPGEVIETWPKANTTVKPGRVVYVTINSFNPKMVNMNAPFQDISLPQVYNYLHEMLGIPDNQIQVVYEPYKYENLVFEILADGKPIRYGSSFPLTARLVVKVGGNKAEFDQPLPESEIQSIVESQSVDEPSPVVETTVTEDATNTADDEYADDLFD